MCVKTTLTRIIEESFKVVFEGRVFWVRAKEITGWVPDFIDVFENVLAEDKEEGEFDVEDMAGIDKDEQGEKNSVADSLGVQDTEVSECEFEKVADSFDGARENKWADDPFGLDGLLNGSQGINSEAGKDHTPTCPPGFTPDHPVNEGEEVRKAGNEMGGQPVESKQDSAKVQGDEGKWDADNFEKRVDEDDCVSVMGPLKDGFGDSRSYQYVSMSQPRPPSNGISLIENFNNFIMLGRAMGWKMAGTEKDLKVILRKVGGENVFK